MGLQISNDQILCLKKGDTQIDRDKEGFNYFTYTVIGTSSLRKYTTRNNHDIE